MLIYFARMIYMADIDNGAGGQWRWGLPDAILHIFFVELFSSQYYSELVFMVFYQKYTPIYSA